MADHKPEFVETIFEQVESQVQFGDKGAELFLLSYGARMERDAFAKRYLSASSSELIHEALRHRDVNP